MDTYPKNFGLRLRRLVEDRGTIEAAYRQLGVSRATLFNWFERDQPPPGAAMIEKLRRYLGPDSELILDSAVAEEAGQAKYLVKHGLRFIPVISWTHAGEAVAYEQIPQDQQERVATFSTDPKAFAVEVEGESMLPDFKPGDRVIVAPSREPRNGKPVVAKLSDDGVVLRIYTRLNATTVRLASLRPEVYPSIDYTSEQVSWIWPVEELSRKI